jgi:mandelate racemase
MLSAPLTIKCIRARPLLLKLERPIVAKIATISDWPVIVVDLYTHEDVIGRSYI